MHKTEVLHEILVRKRDITVKRVEVDVSLRVDRNVTLLSQRSSGD